MKLFDFDWHVSIGATSSDDIYISKMNNVLGKLELYDDEQNVDEPRAATTAGRTSAATTSAAAAAVASHQPSSQPATSTSRRLANNGPSTTTTSTSTNDKQQMRLLQNDEQTTIKSKFEKIKQIGVKLTPSQSKSAHDMMLPITSTTLKELCRE